MTNYTYVGGDRLREGYSVDIVEENGSWVVYFNTRWHMNKRSKVGPDYALELSHTEILQDVHQYITTQRWGDIFHCPCCGR